MGHHSVLEHVAITFAIDKISRACSHQLVRHRIASYSQQSQRYVKYNNIDYIIPPSIKKNEEICLGFLRFMEDIEFNYSQLIDLGVTPEDARYILPNAVATNITMTVNARELIEMCKLRLCMTAQWEIRSMFEMICACVRGNKELTFLSDYLGPKCIWNKVCNEGKRSCGKFPTELGEKKKNEDS